VNVWSLWFAGLVALLSTMVAGAEVPDAEARLRQGLDAPLLFTRQHSYTGIHIYDTYYKWPPGGGGIYVLENPAAPVAERRFRTIIDPASPETLGLGVYSYPELSWDATRLLFCFKGEAGGSTSVYEIGVDGRGLRRLTDPVPTCTDYKGSHAGQHDIAPAYLPDGRIVLLSTRPSGLVPCANTGVAILHVMNADGSDLHPISINHVNDFDPHVLPDGRILHGRWEYVDKNALTIQSLWTINPDGSQETALFANNMTFPEAILDARPVPGSHLVVGTLAKHNASPYGSIAFIDPRLGKNAPAAITNLEHPENPVFDLGQSCEPWPLSDAAVLFSGRPADRTRNVIEMMDRSGHRFVLLEDPEICLHSPMLIKPRPRPPVIVDTTDRKAITGRFYVQDIYRGLDGVKRGEIKWLRLMEETSRVSPTSMGGSPFNQVYLVSAALAFSAKIYHGIVPVDAAGSAYFEAPAGRALFVQALDAEGRMLQSMRTFVQAAPGTTRSCIGCHEAKYGTAGNAAAARVSLQQPPHVPQPESWGSGYMDYPTMVQPILDRHCASCHGGEKDIAAGIDLSGGWTEYFNISYETLANRAETQLTAYWIAGIDCMNGTALWSSRLFPPRSHGSGAAPLAELLVSGHQGRVPDLSRRERDLLLAWIDSNGVYNGAWDQTAAGCAARGWKELQQALGDEMRESGCLKCHGDGKQALYLENDWVNLRQPELSRILRAPLPAGAPGYGLGFCRDRAVTADRQRIHLLWKGYAHAVQPPEWFERHTRVQPDRSGEPVVSFASTEAAPYQRLLARIRQARDQALAAPRVDMPGAEVSAGASRMFLPPPLPNTVALNATPADDGAVLLNWERSARTIGLEAELHRGSAPDFALTKETLQTVTALGRYADTTVTEGRAVYALCFTSPAGRSQPVYTSLDVPVLAPPAAPTGLVARAVSAAVRLRWEAPAARAVGYHVYRGDAGAGELQRLTTAPQRATAFTDGTAVPDVPYRYVVRAVNRRAGESDPSAAVEARAILLRDPVLTLAFSAAGATGALYNGETVATTLRGNARCTSGGLDTRPGGELTIAHREEFDLGQPLSLACWVRVERGAGSGSMPVLVGCGMWGNAGWFLQWLGGSWRWYVGGINCDGGRPEAGRWMHLVATVDGQTLRLFQDGQPVAEAKGTVQTERWPGDLFVGTYGAIADPSFATTGQFAGFAIYHRVLGADEIARLAQERPAVATAAATP
jgi:hypothetical protein